jgi:hypothetical protein
MTQRSHTKDEKFVLALYEEAMKLGDPYQPVDCYFVGKKIGLQDHGIEITCRNLAQANFIKKEDGKRIFLTPNGERLVQRLQD